MVEKVEKRPRLDEEGSPLGWWSRLLLNAATGWEILIHAVRTFGFHGGANLAASIAFYAILSIIPLLTLTTLVLGILFGSNPAIHEGMLKIVQVLHPRFPVELLDQLTRIDQKEFILGWVGLLALIWTAALIFSSIERAFGIVFRAQKKRNYFLSRLLAMTMIPLAWIIGMISVALAHVSIVIKNNPLIPMDSWLASNLIYVLFQHLLPFLLLVCLLTIVYKAIPTVPVKFKHAFIGGFLFSSLVWIAKYLYIAYFTRNDQYHVIYGPLETVVTLILWVFYISIVLLFCAELIASYQKRDLILLEKIFLANRDSE